MLLHIFYNPRGEEKVEIQSLCSHLANAGRGNEHLRSPLHHFHPIRELLITEFMSRATEYDYAEFGDNFLRVAPFQEIIPVVGANDQPEFMFRI